MATRSLLKKPLGAILLLLAVVVLSIVLKLAVNYFLLHFGSRSAPVTISKETTFITKPLTADGYPDYIAALNDRGSQGVTPKNNAVVLVFRAMGPELVARQIRDRYCALLGIGPPPEKGDYFVALDAYVKTLKRRARHPAGR